MIKGNNKKPQNPNYPGWNNKLWQRIISLIIVFVLVTDTMFSGGLFGLLKFSTVLKAEAYNPTTPLSTFSGTSYSFSNDDSGRKQFADYCYYYSTDDGGTFCGAHKGDTLTLTFADLPESFQFMGLGNSSVPFEGTVQFLSTGSMSNISLPRALFSHVNAKAKITDAGGNDITLEITRNSTASSPLLADHVHGTGSGSWKIKVPSTNSNSFAGVIGQLEANASVTLEFENASTAVVSNTLSGENDIKDVGEICGIMKTGSSLTVTDTTATRTAVSSANGNAGSLVGSMEGSASLTLNSYPAFSSVSVTSGNGYAGGLVGKSSTSATITGLTSPLAIGGTVTGTEGAGGLYGHYINTASSFDLKDYNITATVSADNCGGVFGVLENNKGTSETALELTIKNTENAGTVSVSSGSSATSGYFGGIAGKYTTDDLKNSLILDSLSLSATSNAAFNSFGGAIGIVDSTAYIKADGLSVTATGTAQKDSDTYFGGLIGKTSDDHEVFIDLGDFTLSADSAGYKGGGVAGSFANGVLRLSGITNLSSAKSQKGGQIIGVNDNVLVYALGDGTDGVSSVRDNTTNEVTTAASGWTFKRSSGSEVDDLGTWGEVVRSIDDSATTNIKFDATAHTATVAGVTADATDGDYKIASASDFKNIALNIQLNTSSAKKECLLFTANSANSSTLLGGELTVTATIDLSGTGITGFMRDGGASVGNFSGSLDATNSSAESEPKVFTITLAAGEPYGYVGNTAVSSTVSYAADGTPSGLAEGMGQIYRHQYNGLFASAGGTNCAINNVKIGGHIIVSNKVDNMNIGGVAAVNGGALTLSKVIADEYIYYNEPSVIADSENKNIGGFIGEVKTNGTININGLSKISATFDLNGDHSRFNVYGGAIGRISAGSFTLNIGALDSAANKLTNSLTVKANGLTTVGADSNGGGLVGYITDKGSYASRIVNINNLDYDSFKMANASSTNGGGLLGYRWLNATANVDGMTVTNAKINNVTTGGTVGGNTDVGVMCYQATGRWNVNNLTVTKMSMSDGAGASLGMLVNKAYDGAKGLYLDVLKAGYTLTDKTQNSGITLPNTLGVYDELAAYSAADVIKGTYTVGTTTYGAGVISINMNGGRHNPEADPADTYTKTKITETGTYQNQLTSASSGALESAKYANAHSRYYYNLDVMSKNDAEQNIMLWSVNHYAASNINGLFVSTSSPFSFDSETDVNLSDYSYYPVYSVSSLTLKNINLEFGYSGIYSLEGNSTFNTDSYNRDPGANNQHYLMQSGLFINGTEGSTLTLDTVKLSGDFLENSTYQGALFSGTTSGSINVNGLLLDGITPKYNNSGTISNYTGGYLLVKKVNRADAFKENIQLTLKDISTSDNYTVSNTTAAVSKSLFGDVYGPVIGINVSDVKLDARSSSSAVTGTSATALNSAYGTVNSIFTTATLFNKLETSQTATMIYNYSWDKDWGPDNRSVTYGKEVSESVEYADKENKYYNDSRFTDPTNNNHTSEPEYDFSTNWLPYVATAYTANQTQDVNGCYYRELKVNVPATAYAQGCGTYNDPYIIDSGAKLQAIAALINDASKTVDLPSLILPKTLYNGVEANTTGARWCNEKNDHAVFSYNNGYYTATIDDNAVLWSVDDVRLYLANAYYSLSAPTETSGYLELTDQYLGLGGTDVSGKYAFRGVIVGNSQTISNSSKNPLVKVSNGCVLKGLTVRQSVDVEVTAQDYAGYDNAYFGYNTACQYYGGLIGEIMGGDNIIDDSYVNFGSTTVTLTGSKGTIVPVGGYVGVIVYGGLIFKNIDARKTTIDQTHLNVVYKGSMGTTTSGINLASETKIVDGDTVKNHEAWAAIYVNPIVGRVINGYAVNETGGTAKDSTGASVTQFSVTEDGHYHDDDNSSRSGVTHTLQNGKKHYTITDLDPNLAKLDVTKVASSSEDGNIDVPNAQALFVLSLITQSAAGTATDKALGAYTKSLSYGTYTDKINNVDTTCVYGMSHNADYSDVGTDTALIEDDPETENVDESNITDYQKLAYFDTANNTDEKASIPYIVKHYTRGSTEFRTVTETVIETETTYNLDGLSFVIKDTRGDNRYLVGVETQNVHDRDTVLNSTTNRADATEIHFEKCTSSDNYYLWFGTADNKTYLQITNKNGDRGNLKLSSTPYEFTVEKYADKIYEIGSTDQNIIKYINYSNKTSKYHFEAYKDKTDKGNQLKLCAKDTGAEWNGDVTTVTETEVTYTTFKPVHNYPARCVTSSLGYYDISLTGSGTYQLPDSFRGLGCVGNYATGYCIKLNEFNGAGCTIDEDIYLNKYQKDNYFNKLHNGTTQYVQNNVSDYSVNNEKLNHGIGLFDSLTTKDPSGTITNFILTGSVNTEIYDNTYKASSQELALYKNNDTRWLSVGGVVGTGFNESNIIFDQIILDGISVSGSCAVGGIMGFSCNKGDYLIEIIRCRTDNVHGLSVKMNSSSAMEDDAKARNAIGGFVGKCYECKVNIYGTAAKKNNTTFSNYSTVKLSSFGFEQTATANYYCCAGGLVGFAGDGCQAYDMYVVSNDSSSPVTIGGSKINFAGGICGGMQSWKSGTYEKTESGHTKDDIIPGYEPTCFAIFKNCTVDNINIEGQMVGGLYGGKWGTTGWTPYSITVDNCNMVGNSTNKNTIQAIQVYNNSEIYAGGFIGRGLVLTDGTPNIHIKDSKVSNYTITGKYCGGFIGYAGSFANNTTMTCYIHDSSVEDCVIGESGNYAGGAIGRVQPKNTSTAEETASNRMLGYNIKLDNVTSNSGNNMGAWVGYKDSGKVSIQFTGMAIYGQGFSKNIGNNASLEDASFVFADYSGASKTAFLKQSTTAEPSVAPFQYGDEDSVTESFAISSENKTVTQTITTVTVNEAENQTTTQTQTNVYNYGTSSEDESDPVEMITESKTIWSFDQTSGTVKRIVEDPLTQKITTTTYTLTVSNYNRTASNSVDMPKYPYVNINPQSSMGTSGQGEEETSEIISGDAAVLNDSTSETAAFSDKTAASTMALKIYEDLSDTSNSRRYTTFKDHNDTDAAKINEGYKIDEYMKRSVDDDGDRISNYYDEKGYKSPQTYDNFACVVIANNITPETTDLINRYAQLVTNTSKDYSKLDDSDDYFDIVVSPCKLQDGKFVIDTSEGATAGLDYDDSTGEFSLNGAHADSLSAGDTFTLVDIQFKDPLNKNKVAYHLYIPVYTIKEIEITFSAAVMNGTNSVSYNVPAGTEAVNPYDAKLALATLDTQVDNLNTWYTTYIRYTYDRNDIIALLDSGNLNWSHNKYFYIDKTEHSATSMLPVDTYMILVDPNGDHDKKYQVLLNATDFARTDVTIGSGASSYTTSRITFDFTKFKDSSATPAPFEVSTFNELIAKKITPETVSAGTGKYNSVEGTPSNINTGDKHYVYVKNDAGTPTYYEYVGTGGDTNLTLDDGEIYENYYVSMYVPGAANDTSFYGYYIRTPESFAAPSYESRTNNATPKSAKIDCHYGDNTSTVYRQVYIGNLFEQTTEFTVLPGDTEIDAGNHTLDVFATTTITPRSNNIVAILNAVHADIYHSFNLFLDRKGEDGKILNKIYDIKNDGNEIKAWYSVDTPISEGDDMDNYNSISTENIDRQDSYINVTTANIRKLGENGAESNLTADGVTIYSRVTLQFNNYMNEFPEKVANDTGVSVRAASNLAYDTSSLAFSNMSASLEEPAATKHIYYRQSYSNATLNYYSKSELDCYDTDGSPSENYSKLGVSGLYSMNEYMPVNTTAQYNVQNIESTVEDADNLILTLSLQKKTDTPTGGPYTAATYQNVSSINEYWGAVVRDGTTHEVTPNTKGEPVTSSGTNLRIKCGTYDEIKTVAANTQTFTVTIPKATNGVPGFTYDGSGYIEIDIDFNAKTGADFTEYANYKVNLSVMLMDGAEEIAGSYAPDYLIYTNAKVNHEFLKH